MRPLLLLALLFAPSVAAAEDDPGLPAAYLDAVVTYGIGGQSALGGELHGTASWTLGRGDVDGALDVGLRLGYENEPAWLAPWLDPRDVDAAAHRLRTHLTLGPTLRFGSAAREFSLGLHAYAGPTFWQSSASVRLPAYDVEGAAQVSRLVLDLGALLRFTWRPDPAVGLAVVVGAPVWGLHSSYLVDLFHVGLGLAFRLR
jgi:hypothetical protein